jgi:hypothetical protein
MMTKSLLKELNKKRKMLKLTSKLKHKDQWLNSNKKLPFQLCALLKLRGAPERVSISSVLLMLVDL